MQADRGRRTRIVFIEQAREKGKVPHFEIAAEKGKYVDEGDTEAKLQATGAQEHY
jgi:hypothetical protein